MDIALVTAVVALVSGLVTASVTSWLGGREKAANEVREQRLRAYPVVWKRTSAVSRWPHTNIGHADLADLHLDLRQWYYEIGGLYLSEGSRERYGDLQRLVEAHIDHAPDGARGELSAEAYDDLMEMASAFRSALTDDLESRRQRSLIWEVSRARRHLEHEREAKRRLDAVNAKGGGKHIVQYELSDADRTLVPPPAPPTPADS